MESRRVAVGSCSPCTRSTPSPPCCDPPFESVARCQCFISEKSAYTSMHYRHPGETRSSLTSASARCFRQSLHGIWDSSRLWRVRLGNFASESFFVSRQRYTLLMSPASITLVLTLYILVLVSCDLAPWLLVSGAERNYSSSDFLAESGLQDFFGTVFDTKSSQDGLVDMLSQTKNTLLPSAAVRVASPNGNSLAAAESDSSEKKTGTDEPIGSSEGAYDVPDTLIPAHRAAPRLSASADDGLSRSVDNDPTAAPHLWSSLANIERASGNDLQDRKPRRASFSGKQVKKKSSKSGLEPMDRNVSAVPWDSESPSTPPLSSTPAQLRTFEGEKFTTDHSDFYLRIFDKPNSQASALWDGSLDADKTAFDEVTEVPIKSASLGKAGGGRLRSGESESPAEVEQEFSARQRTASLSEKSPRGTYYAGGRSPRPKQYSTVPKGGSEIPRGWKHGPRVITKRRPVQDVFNQPYSEVQQAAENVPGSHGSSADAHGGPRAHISIPEPKGHSKNVIQSAEGMSATSGEEAEPLHPKDPGTTTFPTDQHFEGHDQGQQFKDKEVGGSTACQTSEDELGSWQKTNLDGLSQRDMYGELPQTIELLFSTYCGYLKRDWRMRRQFALLALSSIGWPMYAEAGAWGRPQLTRWFSSLAQLAAETHSQQTNCPFSVIFLEELKELQWILRSVEDFERFLTGQSKGDVHLKYMLSYVPAHRLTIRLKPYLFHEVYMTAGQLQFVYYFSSGLKNLQTYLLLQWKFVREGHVRWSMLQLLGITHQLVTPKPLTGVMILQVDKIDTQEKQVLRLFDIEENKSTQEALMRFETTVTSALTMRIKLVAKHFNSIFWTSRLSYGSGFQLPKCQVAAFYLKRERPKRLTEGEEDPADLDDPESATTEAIETGMFGFEIDVNIAKDLKDRLPPGSMYIQLSFVDPWDYQPVYKEPIEDPTVVPAYRATQILKANLEHDPSLVHVGMARVVYTTIVDAYNSSSPNQAGYDNDRHLVFRVSGEAFKTEESFLAGLVDMVSVPSIHNAAPGTVNPNRIKLIGSARRLVQGEILKTGNFLSGIDYRRHRLIESMVESNTVAVHVFLEGLKDKSANSVFELPASMLFDRIVRRGRSKFTVMHAELVPKKTGATGETKQAAQRVGGYPPWVLVVSNLCVAAFFLIVLASLLLNRHAKLPWWVACICGPQNPFAPEPEPRRDSVAEPADPIGSTVNNRRALFFGRSRSILVPSLGPRNLDSSRWDADQRTKSTDEGSDVWEDGEVLSRSSRRPTLLMHSMQRRSVAGAVNSLSRKGSLLFGGGGRSIYSRQQTKLIEYAPRDEVESSVDKPIANSTAPAVSAVPSVPSGSKEPLLTSPRGVPAGMYAYHGKNAFTDKSVNRDSTDAGSLASNRGSVNGEFSCPGRNKVSTNTPPPIAPPVALRTLELAKSYRKNWGVPSVAAYTRGACVQADQRRSSSSYKRRVTVVEPSLRHKSETSAQRKKSKRVQAGGIQDATDRQVSGARSMPDKPLVKNVGGKCPANSPTSLLQTTCAVTPSSGPAGAGEENAVAVGNIT